MRKMPQSLVVLLFILLLMEHPADANGPLVNSPAIAAPSEPPTSHKKIRPSASKQNATPAAHSSPNASASSVDTSGADPNGTPDTLSPVPSRDRSKDHHPVFTVMDANGAQRSPFPDGLEFAEIVGLQDSYAPGEQILLEIGGKSPEMEVVDENGFDVAAMLFDLAKNVSKVEAVNYERSKKVWAVRVALPTESIGEYKVVVQLFCRNNDSPCSAVYGVGAHINKIVPIFVR